MRAFLHLEHHFFAGKKRGGITRPLFLPFFIILMNRILRWVLADILTGLSLSVYAGVILPACRSAATGSVLHTRASHMTNLKIKPFKNNKIEIIDVEALGNSSFTLTHLVSEYLHHRA